MTVELPKTALVTGAARRIGAEIVRDLVAHGYGVAIHANSSGDEAEELAAELADAGGRVTVIQGDLTDPEFCGRLVAESVAALGPLTLLVNNASMFEEDSLADFDAGTFDQHFAIHVKAPSILVRNFAAELPADCSGLVVNIIDQRVWAPNPRFYTYTLSKAAMWMATRTMAQALAPRVRVNGIGPGPTIRSERQSDDDFARQIDGLILKAGPSFEEFGRTIRFLFDTPSITGQMIALDGGQHLAWQTPDVAEIVE